MKLTFFFPHIWCDGNCTGQEVFQSQYDGLLDSPRVAGDEPTRRGISRSIAAIPKKDQNHCCVHQHKNFPIRNGSIAKNFFVNSGEK